MFSLSRRFIERLSGISMYVAMGGILCLTLLIVVDVFARFVFRHSLLVSEELSGYLLVLIIYMALAETMKRGRHLRVDVLSARFRPRLQAYMNVILSTLGLGALIIVAWRSIIMVQTAYVWNEIRPGILLTPVYLPKLVLAIGLVVFILQYMVELYKMVRKIQEGP